MLTLFLVLTVIILALLLSLSGYLLYKLSMAVFELEDQVEESLDILDVCYGRIANVAELPVASDDPFIRGLIEDIKQSRDAILLIAHKIAVFNKQKTGEAERGNVKREKR